MIKTIIFDTDGVVVLRDMNFSERYAKDFGVPIEKLTPFYFNEFQLCIVGKADLKTAIVKYLPAWGWTRSVDELLDYWFKSESNLDRQMLDSIADLRSKGIKCYQDTNNEKHRADYLWDTLGLKNSFDAMFASGYLGCKKPQQEFWAAIWEKIGRPDKSEVLVFDDDQESVDSANAFGFHAEFYTDFPAYQTRIAALIK
jgi:putative hydrolase of the HAD superfamily